MRFVLSSLFPCISTIFSYADSSPEMQQDSLHQKCRNNNSTTLSSSKDPVECSSLLLHEGNFYISDENSTLVFLFLPSSSLYLCVSFSHYLQSLHIKNLSTLLFCSLSFFFLYLKLEVELLPPSGVGNITDLMLRWKRLVNWNRNLKDSSWMRWKCFEPVAVLIFSIFMDTKCLRMALVWF